MRPLVESSLSSLKPSHLSTRPPAGMLLLFLYLEARRQFPPQNQPFNRRFLLDFARRSIKMIPFKFEVHDRIRMTWEDV
jgi:hypothetical protein